MITIYSILRNAEILDSGKPEDVWLEFVTFLEKHRKPDPWSTFINA